MKFILIVLAILSSSYSFAGNSEQMVKTLLDAGVHPWGRKENLQAEINCKINRHDVFRCSVAGTIFTGDEATAIAELLKTFGVRPYGRKKLQEASILCQIEKNDTVHTCEDINYDYPTN